MADDGNIDRERMSLYYGATLKEAMQVFPGLPETEGSPSQGNCNF
jgi:hypothetical protein